jgi:ABC-type multidrug transport system permease subunit
LQTIEAICILFKFFSSGFLINIFEGQQNPDGTYSYNFNWSGMLGTTIIFIATIAFALFFINFLMTFSQRYALDENGSPVTAQSRRLYYLK